MKESLTKFLERHLNKFIVFALLWVLFAPILLTQKTITLMSFDSTGQIGDTIGGITAPAIGLISAILLYLTLIKQIESTNTIKHEANFRIIYSELEKFETSILAFKCMNRSGRFAIGEFASLIKGKQFASRSLTEDYDNLLGFNLLLAGFQRPFYLIQNLETSPDYSTLLKKDLVALYNINFKESLKVVIDSWNISDYQADSANMRIIENIVENAELIRDSIIKINSL